MGVGNETIYLLLIFVFVILMIRNLIIRRYKILGYFVFGFTYASWVLLIRYSILPINFLEYHPNPVTMKIIPFYSAYQFFKIRNEVDSIVLYFLLYFIFTLSIGIGVSLLKRDGKQTPFMAVLFILAIAAFKFIMCLYNYTEFFDTGIVLVMLIGFVTGNMIAKAVKPSWERKLIKEEYK